MPIREALPGVLRRHSLRWRLPILVSAVFILLLTFFLWAAYRQVERTLIEAGAERARAAASEVAESLSRGLGAAAAQNDRLAASPAIQRFLEAPTAQNREVALDALPARAAGLRRAELWDRSGNLMLEIATPSALPDSVEALRSYPEGGVPTEAEVSAIRAAGEFNYFEITSAVRDSAPDSPLLGYLRRFGQVTASGSPIRRLLGDEASIKVGAVGSGAWTDLYRIVEAPPAPEAEGQFRGSDGGRWVGGHAAIDGTPWVFWVGYPRHLIVAPARAFLRGMFFVALVFVVLAAAAAGALGIRITRPLRDLAGAAEEIAAGNYAKRVSTGRRDEIGRLGETFNTMTERIEEANRALTTSSERTQFALASARIGVWEAHFASRRIILSESMRLVLSTGEAELPDGVDAFLESVHAEDRDSLRAVLEGNRRDMDAFDVGFRFRDAEGGTLWIEGKGRLIYEGLEAVSVLIVSLDASQRHRLEAKLRQSQKMEAVGQLAGGVAHDFNNVLTAIVGHGHLMLRELPQDVRARESVNEILRAGESAAALTRQLLTFSRSTAINRRVVDLNGVIGESEKLLGRLIGANIEFVVELSPDLRPVLIDPAQFEQVIMNLAVNARDAMPSGGSLRISTENVWLGEDELFELSSMKPGAFVKITVSDTGSGMDARTQSRAFEPFFTTKKSGEGTGLGLATVFGIIRQSEGHVHLYSEPGHGTIFRIYLPASEAAPTPDRRKIAKPIVPGGNETILVVEDNMPVRMLAKKILEGAGYRVIDAATGEAALEALVLAGARPDLVLSDVIMPGMTGPELCRRLEARYPEIRILFTSGYAGSALGQHGIGPDTMFIEKPYSPEILANRVGEALGRRPVDAAP